MTREENEIPNFTHHFQTPHYYLTIRLCSYITIMSFQNKACMKPHDNFNNFRGPHCFIAVCMAVAASFMFFMISFLVMDVI